MKLYATLPKFEFPSTTNNSPFERQKKIVNRLKLDYNIDNIESELLTWNYVSEKFLPFRYSQFLQNSYSSFKNGYNTDFLTIAKNGDKLLTPCNFPLNKSYIIDRPEYLNIPSFATDNLTPIFENLNKSVLMALSDCISAADSILNGENKVVAIPCHPGHHSNNNYFGGYCYINNALCAYKYLKENGKKPCIIDLDFHLGDGFNGCKDAVSININPYVDYPYYSVDNLKQFSFNGGINIESYNKLLNNAFEYLSNKNDYDTVIISFGQDTYLNDPEVRSENRTKIDLQDYKLMSIKQFTNDKNVLVIQEGGYSDKTDIIMSNFLSCL